MATATKAKFHPIPATDRNLAAIPAEIDECDQLFLLGVTQGPCDTAEVRDYASYTTAVVQALGDEAKLAADRDALLADGMDCTIRAIREEGAKLRARRATLDAARGVLFAKRFALVERMIPAARGAVEARNQRKLEEEARTVQMLRDGGITEAGFGSYHNPAAAAERMRRAVQDHHNVLAAADQVARAENDLRVLESLVEASRVCTAKDVAIVWRQPANEDQALIADIAGV